MSGFLRVAALVATIAGGAGAVLFLLNSGQNPKPLLLTIMAAWVVAPFVIFALADLVSKKWTVTTRGILHGMIVLATAVTLAFYEFPSLKPAGTPAAFLFILVPPASVMLTALAVGISGLLTPKR